MTKLAYKEVVNMSDQLVEWLNSVGIFTLEELKAVGSHKAFLLIRDKIDERPFHVLSALEATCRDIFKNELDRSAREELRAFYESLD